MWRNECGIALLITIAISSILFILVTISISQAVRYHQAEHLHWEIIRAQYAAEGGVAIRQARLRKDRSIKQDIIKINGVRVLIQLKNLGNQIEIHSTAYANEGVKQTVVAVVDKDTFTIQRWGR